MADNVTFQTTVATPPNATVIATDDVGGAQYQKVKLDVGGDGASTPVDGKLPVGGDVAHDAVDAGNPVKMGGKATDADLLTPVTYGDRVDSTFDRYGAQRVVAATDVGGGQIQLLTKDFGSGNLGVQVNNSSATAIPVHGNVVHDTLDSGSPIKVGGKAKAAAPADVSADADRVDAWFLRNGAQATVVTAAGALIGGDAANGLDVDVTRLPALVAGSANIGDVDVLTLPNVTLAAGTNTNEVVGDVAQDLPIAGNPVSAGLRASTVVPTAMSADGDVVYSWSDRLGRSIVQPGVPIGTEKWATAQYTTTQTGVALLTPTAGKKLVITSVQIQVGGTTAGTVQLWFGGSADTTYSRGTDRAIFDGEFAPSATLKPGALQTKESGWVAAAADDILRVTTSAAINPITFTVWGYEV